jgi:hypothetical protein
MDTKQVIHIGDGRYIEHTEGALYAPPPEPKRSWQRKFKDPNRKPTPSLHRKPKRTRGPFDYEAVASLPGYEEYHRYMTTLANRYFFGGHPKGQTEGYNKVTLKRERTRALKQVKIDMENIKKKVEVSEMAEEALEGALLVMRAPNTQQTKLAAAKLILEFTRSKPVAKSEVSVNKAEEWLASLAHDED